MCLPARTHLSSSRDKNCESHFGPKVMSENGLYHFYLSAKSRRGLNIKTSGVIFRGTSSYHVQKTMAPPKQAVCQFSTKFCVDNFSQNVLFNIEKSNVGDHLKCVFPKFEAKRSHPRGVNGRSKFCKNSMICYVFSVEKQNVEHRLKSVFPKFEAKRSHVVFVVVIGLWSRG